MSGASHIAAQDSEERPPSSNRLTARERLLMWLIFSVLVAFVVYVGFRGYLNPEFLFHFANGMVC